MKKSSHNNGFKNGSRKNIKQIIRSAVKKHSSPLLLISRCTIKKQYDTFRRYLPEVTPYYAVKANTYPDIIKYLYKLGAFFDVASANEMALTLSLGIPPKKLIFAHTIKSEKDLIQASNSGVHLMTYDNEMELYKIKKHCPEARLLLRIRVSNLGSNIELSLKFGADVDQAIPLLQKARHFGLNPVGISFHVGSQCTHSDSYLQALEISSTIFQESKNYGFDLKILDLGGGFPIKHRDSDNFEDFKTMARKIRLEIKNLFDKKTQVIAEPGRFMVGPAGTLITQVVGRTYRNNKNYYYLNDGIYGDFSGIVFDNCKYEFKTLRNGRKHLSTLAGPTCDSFDTISVSEDLPELDLGSVVYVRNIGAYSCASAVTSFNGFTPAKIIMVS